MIPTFQSPGRVTKLVLDILAAGGELKIPKKVLIIDDEEMDVKTLSVILESQGCEVYSADGVTTGLEKVLSWRPADMIFIDLKLPGISGADAMKILRVLLPKQRFCMYTGSINPDELASAEKYGCQILSKPVSRDEVDRVMGTI